MGANDVNFRYLIEGAFTHINGLPISDGTIVNAYWCNDRVVFKANDAEYNLPFSNLMNVCIKTNGEILNQYEASNASEATAFNELGALLSEKVGTDKATQYLIFTYKSKNGQSTKLTALEINQFNSTTANKMVDYFINLPQSVPKPTPHIQPTVTTPTITEIPAAPVQQPVKPKKKKHILLKIFFAIMSISFVIAVVFIISEQGSQPNYEEKNEKAEAEISSLVDGSLSNALSKMEEMGYTATYYFDNGKAYKNDYTNVVKDNFSKDEKQLKKYVITKYENVNAETKTVDLYINTKKEAKKQKQLNELESKLGHINACQAVEKYGKEQYPFGFKLHYMKDLQGYQMVGENNDTWRIQCGVTITNAYGASYDATCQAEITGSNDAPEVTDFVVF